MVSNITSLIIQTVIWLLVFLFLIFMGLEFNSLTTSIAKAGLNIVFLFVLSYLNVKILVPKFFTSKLIVFYFISATVLIILYVYLSKELIFTDTSEIKVTIQRIGNSEMKLTNAWVFLKLVPIVLSVSVLFVSSAFVLIREIYEQNRLKMQVEIEKKATELKLIKTQFGPHFFLNSLNNLYSISIINPLKTSVFIEKLTSLMQYVTYDQLMGKVSLSKEIEFIKNYIFFQLEKGDDLYEIKTDFNKDLINYNLLIEPNLFIPFVENAFKFAYHPNKRMSVEILMLYENQSLYFSVKNDVSDYQRRNNEDGYFGLGIHSVRKLLDNLYLNKYKLNITNTNRVFSVELILDLSNE